MKTCLWALLFCVGLSFAQDWELVKERGAEYDPSGGDFANADTGLFVGNEGVVFGTFDGSLTGVTLREPDGTAIDWKDFQFVNGKLGFACATGGYIFKTTDAGHNWTMIGDTANYKNDLVDLYAVNDQIIYIAGKGPILLKTVDGGQNWTASDFAFGEDLDGGIAFLNADTGVVASDANKGLTWYTHDGGVSWTQTTITFPLGTISSRIYDVDAGGDSTFAVAGYHYTLFISHDFGVSYQLAGNYSIGYDQLKDIQVMDDQTIFAGGTDGYYIKSLDGGATWDTLDTGSGQSLTFLDFTDMNTGYIFQFSGQWMKTTDGGASFQPILDWPNVDFEGLALPADDKIAVTAWGGGELTISEDGGMNWSYPLNYSTGTVLTMYECESVDENTWLIGGSYGDLRKTTDGGQSFDLIDNPMYQGNNLHIYVIKAVNQDTIFAGGSKGSIMRSTNGGDSWEMLENEGSKSVYDIWPINAHQVIAVASSGQIYVSNAAVDSFKLAKDYGSMSMEAVEFRGDVGIVAAKSGHLYRTTVSEWDTLVEVFTEPSGMDLYDVIFVNDTLVYVVGEGGVIYKSSDTGLNWTAESSPTSEQLNEISYRNNILWAVGDNATIIKKDLTPPVPLEKNYIAHFEEEKRGVHDFQAASWGPACTGIAWQADPTQRTIGVLAADFTFKNSGDSIKGYIHRDGIKINSKDDPGVYAQTATIDIFVPAETPLGTQVGFVIHGASLGWVWTEYASIVDDSVLSRGQWNTLEMDIDALVTGGKINDINAPVQMGVQIIKADTTWSGTFLLDNLILHGIPQIAFPPVDNIGQPNDGLPIAYKLYNNYPNPFNPSTTIRYDLKESGRVKLSIYNILGQEVMKLVDRNQQAGSHSVILNAGHLASGMYLYKLEINGFKAVNKLLLLK